MALPKQPVTLSLEQIEQLNQHLSIMRHEINNQLTIIVGVLELVRIKPENAQRMLASVAERPVVIGELLKKFSSQFEAALQITRH